MTTSKAIREAVAANMDTGSAPYKETEKAWAAENLGDKPRMKPHLQQGVDTMGPFIVDVETGEKVHKRHDPAKFAELSGNGVYQSSEVNPEYKAYNKAAAEGAHQDTERKMDKLQDSVALRLREDEARKQAKLRALAKSPDKS